MNYISPRPPPNFGVGKTCFTDCQESSQAEEGWAAGVSERS